MARKHLDRAVSVETNRIEPINKSKALLPQKTKGTQKDKFQSAKVHTSHYAYEQSPRIRAQKGVGAYNEKNMIHKISNKTR